MTTPEQKRAYKRAYYERMKDDPEYKRKRRESSAKWRAAHPEKQQSLVRSPEQRAARKRWAQKNPHVGAAHRAKRRVHKRNDDPRLVAVYEIAAWLRANGDDVHVDHIVPISKGGTHTYENLQILSAVENLRKGAKL